jgi:acetylglutamate kinase
VGVGEDGKALNINADLVAGAVAEELCAEELILLTDVPGVMRGGTLVGSLTVGEARALVVKGEITGGMIPKITCAVDAVEGGVKRVRIVDGRLDHSLLLVLLADEGTGTRIVPD